jgi:hypothetical protein
VILKLNRSSYYRFLGKEKGLGKWRIGGRAEICPEGEKSETSSNSVRSDCKK